MARQGQTVKVRTEHLIPFASCGDKLASVLLISRCFSLVAGEIVNANFLLTLFDGSLKEHQEGLHLICCGEQLFCRACSTGLAQW